MSVKRAQREIDADEFAWWRAYFQLERWDETRDDWRTGILAATMANGLRGLSDMVLAANGGRPGHHTPYAPTDFLPQYAAPVAPPKRPVTLRDMIALFRQQTLARGGTVQRPEGSNGTRV